LREILGPDCALTFSFGTLRRSDYAFLKRAGVDRYLIRFESSDEALHLALRGSPLKTRLRAIEDLGELGFEVGTGFMTGLPGSTEATLEGDLELSARISPDMIGVGPFIPHPETPLGGAEGRGLEPALRAVAALRILLPEANIPATTAAGSIAPDGRERMLAVGANVLMPNIGPVAAKKDYELYPGKICLDEDGLDCMGCLAVRAMGVGKRLDRSRGDSPSFARRQEAKPQSPAGPLEAAGNQDRPREGSAAERTRP
ncbi:MAG TPA: radical SAM protein, partial [Rectinemataceae bacterium]|nr:radical SAM protein [Rectinemataceae bacterium]